jgi:hypothetical protein
MKTISVESLDPKLRESLHAQQEEQALLLTEDARPVGLLVSLPQALRVDTVDAVVWSEAPHGPLHLVVHAKHSEGNGEDGTPLFGSGRGMLTINTEDEDHLADFAEYMK